MPEFEDVVDRIEKLLAEVESFEEPHRLVVLDLLDAIDALHRRAVRHLGRQLDPATIDALKRQSLHVAWLLEVYGVGIDLRAAADRALEEVRPYIESHGGRVEILGAEEGVVRLRMAGACSGCTASAITLREGIERAFIDHMPGYAGMEVEEQDAPSHPPPGPTLLQIGRRDRTAGGSRASL